jgi:hypothetical protein
MYGKNVHISTTAFEPSRGGFVFYENAWSRGIPVSADERQAYLYGSQSEWLEAIAGREATMPRRPYWRTVKRILTAALLGYDPAQPPP